MAASIWCGLTTILPAASVGALWMNRLHLREPALECALVDEGPRGLHWHGRGMVLERSSARLLELLLRLDMLLPNLVERGLR